MPRKATKRQPTKKPHAAKRRMPLVMIIPALLVVIVIVMMPSMLTGSISWPWSVQEPVPAPIEAESTSSSDEVLIEFEPACCVDGSAYYGYTQDQCAGAGGSWEIAGFCLPVMEEASSNEG